jgi:hypothetical protein
MRPLLLLTAACVCSAQQWTLYTCMATTKNYVVGAKLPPSGVFHRTAAGEWLQTGHPNPFTFGLDYDPRDPSRLYVAAGNGLICMKPDARPWKILTGSDVTEIRDLSVDSAGNIYYAWVAGVRVSRDGGANWNEIGGGLPRKYTETVRVDRRQTGVLLAGTEQGIYRSEDDGGHWSLAGAAGFSIMRIEQSPHDPCFWLAATEQGGLFASHDCGKSFENSGRLGVGANLYDIAFDPTTPSRIAVAGWGTGVSVSSDNGTTWESRNASLPNTNVWSIAFDPGHTGRLYAGVHEEALYVSDDAGRTWKRDGLQGTVVYRMRFVPEGRGK